MKVRISRLRLGLSRWSRDYWTLHLLIIGYIAVLSVIVLLRYYSFEASAWDLGIFDQACYSTLKGKLFYYTVELYANPGGSVFGVHFSPILFGVVPFYALFPAPETLLIIQTVALAVSAYPVFFLAKSILNSQKLGLFFSVFYLTNPHVYGINVFDFHPDAFFVPLALFSLYFFVKEKWGFYLVFMTMSLLTKEFMSFSFLAFAIGELLLMRKHIATCLRERRLFSKKILILILTVLIGSVWYVMATRMIHFFNPSPPSGFAEGSPWEILGGNPLNPSSWINVLGFNFLGAVKFELESKLFYLVTILAPLAFLPVFKASRLLPVAFWLILAFLSNYAPYYGLGLQYSAVFIPFLMLAAIEGFGRLSDRLNIEKGGSIRTARKLLLVGILASLTFSFAYLPATDIKPFTVSAHDGKVQEVLNWVRSDFPSASILTQYDLFPHISNMVNSYVIPPAFPAFKREYYFEYTNALFDKKIDFIVIDLNPKVRTYNHYVTHMVAIKNIYEKQDYNLYASIDGILVFKFGECNLTRYEPFVIHYRLLDLTMTEIAKDTTLFFYFLPPGEYNVTYHLKVSSRINERAFTLEIDQNRSAIASKDILGTDFPSEDTYTTFTLPVSVSNPSEEVEFLVTNPSDRTETKVDWLEISIVNHYK